MRKQFNEQPSFEKVWLMFQESQKEFDRRNQELEKKFQDTDKRFQDTDKKINVLSDLFTSQWGKLVEALLGPHCIKLFQDRGIAITQTQSNVKSSKGGSNMEIEVFLVDDTECVLVEIKTTAKVVHINELIKTLENFKTFFPRYADCKVYGAIASLKFDEKCEKYAESKGLYVIKSKGEGLVEIKNPLNFKPKAF